MSKELFKNIGLSTDEVKVYTIIISKLVRTLEEIEIISGRDLTPEVIHDSITQLEKKNFIRVIPGKVPQFIALAPPIAATSEIDKQVDDELRQIQDDIQQKWDKGHEEIKALIDEYQQGQDIFLKTKTEFNTQIQKLDKEFKAKHSESREQIKNMISEQEQENNTQFDDCTSKFSMSLNEEVQKNISNLETALTSIKNNQEEQRKNDKENLASIYNGSVEGFNSIFSQMKQSIQNLQKQVINASENLNSSLTNIEEQTNTAVEQNKETARDDLNTIGVEFDNKISDKLTIFNQQVESIQKSITQAGEESLSNIGEIVNSFSQSTSKSSLSIKKLAQENADHLWSNFVKTMESLNFTVNEFAKGKEKFDAKEIISSISGTMSEIQSILDNGIKKLNSDYNEGLKQITSDFLNQFSSFQAKIIEDTSKSLESVKNEIDKQYSDSIQQIEELTIDLSNLFDTNTDLLSQESSSSIQNAIQNFQLQTKEVLESLSGSYTETISNISETEKTINEDFELNLVDTITSLDQIKLEMKEIQSEGKVKIIENIQHLQNVATEEFSSFNASASMMLGQMQSTLVENVSERTTKMAQNFDIIKQVSESINQVSKRSQDEISNIVIQLKTSFDESIGLVTEAFSKDTDDISVDVDTITKTAKSEQEKQTKASVEKVQELSGDIEKVTLELGQNIPKQLEEYQAQHTDDFNKFDRAVKAELNKVKARLQEIDREVRDRLGKRVSLGKGGFQDIEKIVKAALDEFEVAQKHTENLIDGQINNFEVSSSNLSETITNTLSKENIAIQRILDTVGDNLSQSVDKSYDLALNKITELADIVKTKIISKKDLIIKQFGDIFSNLSGSLSDNLTVVLIEEFRNVNESLTELNRTSKAPAEIETLVNTEIDNFIQNLQLGFQTVSETGASRIHEVINEFLLVEINKFFENMTKNDLNILKETFTGNWKSSSQKMITELQDINQKLPNQIEIIQDKMNMNLQNISSSLQDIQKDVGNLIDSKMKALNSAQTEKYQNIPLNFKEKRMYLSNTLESTQNTLIQTFEKMNKSTQDSLSEITSDISASTGDKLQEIRKIPQKIEQTSIELTSIIKNHQKETETNIDNMQSSSLAILKTTQDYISKERESFIEKIENIDTEVEKEIAEFKEQVTKLNTIFPEKKIQIDKDFQTAIKTFNSDIKDTFSTLETEISAGKIQINQKIDRLYQEFKTSVESYFSAGKSFIDSLDTRYKSIVENINDFISEGSIKETLEREKKNTIDVQQAFFEDMDRNLTSFSNSFGNLITNNIFSLLEDMKSTINDVKTISSSVTNSYYNLFSTILTEILQHQESESQKTSSSLEFQIGNFIDQVNNKAVTLQDSVSSDLSQLITSIPKRIGSGLTKSKDLMSAISEVQKMATEIPIANLESTYLQTLSAERVIQTLNAILDRTKSTIQIMIPRLSMIPIDMIKRAGTRRRIQILTQIDAQNQAIQIKEEFGNVQLKHYDRVEVYAITRDGDEEAAIGSGKEGNIQFIMTTDSKLIVVLKEIFQNLWPRGKAI